MREIAVVWHKVPDTDCVLSAIIACDYLEKKGVTVVYFPYGVGISSSSLKEQIYKNYEKLKNKADNHFPADANVNSWATVIFL